jgi:hypothetical protein
MACLNSAHDFTRLLFAAVCATAVRRFSAAVASGFGATTGAADGTGADWIAAAGAAALSDRNFFAPDSIPIRTDVQNTMPARATSCAIV